MRNNPLFEKLLREAPYNEYIGQGNPDAEILFVGKEHGFADAQQETLEIENNLSDWKAILEGKSAGVEFYNPMDGYKNQCFKFRGENSTSMTWYKCQSIINLVYPDKRIEKGTRLNFLRHSFITELSTKPSKTSRHKNSETLASITKRCGSDGVLRNQFYRSFPVVVAFVSNYVDIYGSGVLEDTFNVEWIGTTQECGNLWVNIHYSQDKKRMVIHCPHLSYAKVDNNFLEGLAQIIRKHLTSMN